MNNVKELEAQLDALLKNNRTKESELRKQIAKQKKSEEQALINAIGKFARKRFYTLEIDLRLYTDFFRLHKIELKGIGINYEYYT